MKKEITFKDYVKVVELRNSIEELAKQLSNKQKDITELFDYFQQTKYYKTNFFIEDTTECDLYNYLDELERTYLDSFAPVFKVIGRLNYYLVKLLSCCKKNKKEFKVNEKK